MQSKKSKASRYIYIMYIYIYIYMYIVCVCVCVYVCDGNFSMTIEHTITIRDEKEATENECKTYFIVFEITHEKFFS